MPVQKDTLTEIGVTGLTQWSGYVFDEFLPELVGPQAVKIFQEMANNDATIGAFLLGIEMFMRQVPWYIESAGNTPQDQEADVFLESCMYDMSQSWQDFMGEVTHGTLLHGWSYHETVYKIRGGDVTDPTRRSQYDDGRIGWRKWAVRSQDTLLNWKFDDQGDGGLLGMVQQAPPNFAATLIPIEKALLFRFRSTKGNPEGKSILRTAYRAWFYKKAIEELEAIGIERDFAGLPTIWVPPNILNGTEPDELTALNNFKKMITDMRRNEQDGLLMPLEYDDNNNKVYDFQLASTGSRRQFDTNAIIQRKDQEIARTVLADVLLLGSQDVGSYALAVSKTGMFVMVINAFLDSIEDVINTFAVPRLFKLNAFTNLTGLPKIKHGAIEKQNIAELGAALKSLADAGMVVFPDDTLKEYIFTEAGLPIEDHSVPQPQTQTQDQTQAKIKTKKKEKRTEKQ